MSVIFQATGHPALQSTHPSTIEITKEHHLTTNGNCIVAVNSSIGPADLSKEFRAAFSMESAMVRFILKVDQHKFVVEGKGDPRLTLTHPTDFVIRRSGFVSDRTLMIHADKSACDLPRQMVTLLRDPSRKVEIEISTRTRV